MTLNTCPKMMQFDTILQTCLLLSQIDMKMIRFYCMAKYSKIERIGEELPDKRQSYSLDRERSIARDQKVNLF